MWLRDTPFRSDFPTGGGEMGALIRAHDWSTSPLGSPDAWPQALCSVVRLMLDSGFPMFVAWGRELGFLYNDAYAEILGNKHPQALGRRFDDIWSEIWPDISPLIDAAMAGEATYRDNLPLLMNRKGFDEQTWFTFAYSPVRDDSGVVAGMFCTCAETTGQVLAERRLTEEREALRESELRFRALVNASSDVVYRMSPDWTEMRQLDGRGFLADTEQPSVRWVDEYIYPEDRPHVLKVIEAAVQTKGAFELEHRVRRADGTVGWTSSRAVPVIGVNGEIVEWFGMAGDITDRKRAEERVFESERELRFATKAGRFGTWRLDLVTGELATSETCRTNFGRHPDAPFSYTELRDAVHPDDTARMAAAVERSIATGADYDIEYRIVTPDGETRWVAIRAQPTYSEDGAPLGMSGVSIDITDRKRTGEELARSESRYRALFDAVDAGFCVIELKFDEAGRAIDYRHIETNPAFERQTGLVDYVGIWVRDALPDLERHWFDIYGEVARTGCAARFENWAEPLGRWFDVHAFRTGAPEDHHVAILFNDITARKAADEQLRALNENLETLVADRTVELRRFRDIVEATTSPICAFDTEYRLIAFNKAHNDEFRRVNGFDTKLGDVFPDLFIPEQQPVMRALMDRALAGERFTVTEEFGRPELGQPLWEISYTPLCDESGAVIGAFHLATDTSDRLRAEADLAAAQEALRQSQKMEAMGSLTGGVAHDFNNLLTPIVGALDMLQRKGLGGEREQRLIDGAAQSAERARILVQRLLAFARRQPLQATPVDLSQLVTGMADLIASTLGPQIKVVVNVPPGLPPANADLNQLEMAVLNLAVNARDAMPDGGTLRISLAAVTIDSPHRSGLEPGHYLALSVADTGSGMDEATLARAVEPFFSTKGIGKGTGLGLSMVHGLASQLGGAVSIASTLAVGTNVELWLPQGAVSDAAPETVEKVSTAVSAKGTVLLVDDEDLVRLTTADMLKELGYSVVETASAEEALRMVEGGFEPDIVVTDHLMPGITGTELAWRLRARRPSAKVLIVSGYAETVGIAPDLPRLTKPFRSTELAASLAELT